MNLVPPQRPATAVRRIFLGALILGALCVLRPATPARALVHFDFEQKFLIHPDVQIWDFCVVRDAGLYHVFYTMQEISNPGAARADSLGHATSPDLAHWTIHPAIFAVSSDPWEAGALWAPDVVRDDAAGLWAMAYTGADARMNQRISFATSTDLFTWQKSGNNPVIMPDTTVYTWSEAGRWGDFRDPFLYRQDDLWHVLVTAAWDQGEPQGVLYHGTSPDLVTWQDVGPIFANDGLDPWRVPESPQYHRIGNMHHLFFGEFDKIGVTVLSAPDPSGWTMANQHILDLGYAPEVDEFDPGHRIFSRLANFYMPNGVDLGYVVRFDTLLTAPDGSNPVVHKPDPMAGDWIVKTGYSNLAAPTYDDNRLWRGEPGVGLVGHGYYGSGEWYQGPLSRVGGRGLEMGDWATGVVESYRFPVTGNRMTMLVGGGDYPATCYIALVDADTGEELFRETGGGEVVMTPREWDLSPHIGRTCYLTIIDAEEGEMGHINIDEISEVLDVAAAPDVLPAGGVQWHRPRPNPANPRTDILFSLAGDATVDVTIHDARGRRVWSSGGLAARAGLNRVSWSGQDAQGRAAAAGLYLYAISVGQRIAAAGKVSLVK